LNRRRVAKLRASKKTIEPEDEKPPSLNSPTEKPPSLNSPTAKLPEETTKKETARSVELCANWDFKAKCAVLQLGGVEFKSTNIIQMNPKKGDSGQVGAQFADLPGETYKIRAVWWALLSGVPASSSSSSSPPTVLRPFKSQKDITECRTNHRSQTHTTPTPRHPETQTHRHTDT
jgi:hypothetical protein